MVINNGDSVSIKTTSLKYNDELSFHDKANQLIENGYTIFGQEDIGYDIDTNVGPAIAMGFMREDTNFTKVEVVYLLYLPNEEDYNLIKDFEPGE